MNKIKQLIKKIIGKKDVRFHIDTMRPDLISGWACLMGSPKHSCTIQFKDGNTVVAETTANVMREDLLVAGIGSGAHGFSFDPGLSVFDVTPRTLHMYIDGVKQAQQSVTIRQKPEQILNAFGSEMEKRVDALLALHREKLTREMEQLVKTEQK
ncbi:hypothetical protein [Shewanella youngdeokensis]|uniref:Uncharacterized protein n=1 Tax=Shewanella youngdeokensis TaxID=2999068 RepID=A0ABZ0K2U6_9GAMM|nr:hypothetical protein RGE70_05790 [Shewanella sp. DAU334]